MSRLNRAGCFIGDWSVRRGNRKMGETPRKTKPIFTAGKETGNERGEKSGRSYGRRRGTNIGSYLRCTAESRSPLGYVTCYSRIVTSRVSKAGGVEG